MIYAMDNRLTYVLSAGAAAALIFSVFKSATKEQIRIKSPLDTVLSQLSPHQIDELPYPPNALPGARDVETPYGTIKVYEWGPEDGRKVLFVHGISTPCVSLAAVAENLARRGCRVMLFDLFGRGFSDTPVDVKHDARLYTTQILLALSSSSIPWTGDAAFDLVGYSFGGGISACFTRYFPRLVRSVTLLAPGGIVRTEHISWQSRVLYSTSLLPERFLAYLVLRRLRPPKPSDANAQDAQEQHSSAEAAVGAEVGRTVSRDNEYEPADSLAHSPRINPDGAIAWQIEHHKGFVPAFMSSVRNGPIHNQHPDWAILGQEMARRREATAAVAKAGKDQSANVAKKYRDKVLLVIGSQDPIVLKEEVPEDAKAVLGDENVQVELIDAAHDFPIKKSAELADVLLAFWHG